LKNQKKKVARGKRKRSREGKGFPHQGPSFNRQGKAGRDKGKEPKRRYVKKSGKKTNENSRISSILK